MKNIGLIILFFCSKTAICQTAENSEKNIRWSPTALSFANYAVTDNVDSLPYNPYLANTNVNITYYYKLSKNDSLIIYVENLFVRNGSWVKKEHINDKALLKHEQGHFDVSEIYARKLYAAFAAFHFTKNYKLEIKQVAGKVLAEEAKQQKRYDAETNFSENKTVQKKWNEFIQNGLKVLPETDGKMIVLPILEKKS